jgi:hypothetical protein
MSLVVFSSWSRPLAALQVCLSFATARPLVGTLLALLARYALMPPFVLIWGRVHCCWGCLLKCCQVDGYRPEVGAKCMRPCPKPVSMPVRPCCQHNQSAGMCAVYPLVNASCMCKLELVCVWKTCLASKCIAPRRMRHFFAVPGVYGQCCALSCAFGSPALLVGTGLVAGCCDS